MSGGREFQMDGAECRNALLDMLFVVCCCTSCGAVVDRSCLLICFSMMSSFRYDGVDD